MNHLVWFYPVRVSIYFCFCRCVFLKKTDYLLEDLFEIEGFTYMRITADSQGMFSLFFGSMGGDGNDGGRAKIRHVSFLSIEQFASRLCQGEIYP